MCDYPESISRVEFEDIDDENEEEDDLSPTHSTPVIAAPARTVDAPR